MLIYLNKKMGFLLKKLIFSFLKSNLLKNSIFLLNQVEVQSFAFFWHTKSKLSTTPFLLFYKTMRKDRETKESNIDSTNCAITKIMKLMINFYLLN